MEKLNSFMNTKITNTMQELNLMLENATFLIRNKYMEVEPLIKSCILKCPANIRTLLFQATNEDYDWNNFLKAVENTSWMLSQKN